MIITPHRIQRRRTKGWRMPPNTVYVGRPTRWGNPFRVGGVFEGMIITHSMAATLFDDIHKDQMWRDFDLPSPDEVRRELHGKHLAYWCPLDQPCHADVLLKLANQRSTAA